MQDGSLEKKSAGETAGGAAEDSTKPAGSTPQAALAIATTAAGSSSADGANDGNNGDGSNATSKTENLLQDAALSEPDAMKVIASGAVSKAVAQSRKADLLQQAREDRRRWILQTPLPHDGIQDPGDAWTLDPRLSTIQSSMISKKLPTATKLLSNLYGMDSHQTSPQDVADRIEKLVGRWEDDEAKHLLQALDTDENDPQGGGLRAYNAFTAILLQPPSALLVQGMRNFIRNLAEGTKSTDQVASAVKSYLQSTLESMTTHAAFKSKMDDAMRRSFESFLFAQCQPILSTLTFDGSFSLSDDDWKAKLNELKFIKPTHLDIACLEGNEAGLPKLLAGPIKSLLCFESFYSPGEKLQQVLAFYQGINESLSSAMNPEGTSQADMKLPSADDVLPAMILTVIMSQASRLLRSLSIVEAFATPESLRGKAGYAYTNLYGAVQFLHDLDMSNPSSLTIDPKTFEENIQSCRQAIQDRLEGAANGADDLTLKQTPAPPNPPTNVDVHAVRAARQNGEMLDLKWALQWRNDAQYPPTLYQSSDETLMATGNSKSTTKSKMAHSYKHRQQQMPSGFVRSYSFLAARPEDVRLRDLPKLLQEYRMLVHCTEHLLPGRAAGTAGGSSAASSMQRKESMDTDDDFETARQRSMTS